MLDPAIPRFFEEQKKAWLDENAKKLEAEELKLKLFECESIFEMTNWLENNARKAASRAIASHPSKFSHPDTGVGKTNSKKGTFVSPIIFEGSYRADGFFRTGNVFDVELDSVGDSGALKIESFLKLKMDSDGRALFDHLLDDTEVAQEFYGFSGLDSERLKSLLLAGIAKAKDGSVSTNSKIKQVYFPVGDGYHQLSILTNSGLLFELRKRLDTMRFSPEVKALRELKKNKQFSTQNYSEIYDLTTIGFGGTNPQNISLLSTKYRGSAHMLASVPPKLAAREVHFPKADIFAESLTLWPFKDLFKGLHKVMSIELGGNITRQTILTARDNRIKELVLKIMDTVHVLRSVSQEQYREMSTLPISQVIWLCAHKSDERENSDVWLDSIIHDMVRWLINHYSKVLGDQHILLGNEEFNAIKLLITECVTQHKELLR